MVVESADARGELGGVHACIATGAGHKNRIATPHLKGGGGVVQS